MLERRERKILTAVVAAHALDHISELSFPAVALLVSREFFAGQEAFDRIGLAAAVAAFCFGAANLPSGWLVDRIGPRKVMLLFAAGTGLSLILTGFATTFPWLVAALGLLGLATGLYHPSGNTLISLGVRAQGRAMGIHGMGGNLGLALSPFISASLAELLGWRGAYFALSAPFFLLALLIWKNDFEPPAPPGGAAPGPAAPAVPNGPPYLLLPLVMLFTAGVLNGFCYRGFLTFLPAYFNQAIHLELPIPKEVLAGSLSTGVLLLGIFGQYWGGRLADRINPGYLYAGIFLVSAVPLSVLGGLSDFPLLLASGLFAFCYFANQPTGNVLLVRYTAPRLRGWIFGLWFFANFGVGSLMGWIAGEIGQRLKLSAIFIVLAACLFAAGLAALALGRAERGKTPAAQNNHPA